ncbi:MAG: hypothetical protein LUQ28_12075 [Methylococcaceae bacterium]|nr:hypothetical protein [Methylococcaceae bacterium]
MNDTIKEFLIGLGFDLDEAGTYSLKSIILPHPHWMILLIVLKWLESAVNQPNKH